MSEEKVKISHLNTETRNPKTMDLDLLKPGEIIRIMNEEDMRAVKAVEKALPQIEKAVTRVVQALNEGGRLIYAGAGTSGRIGIMDAVECTPTFSTEDEVQAVIAGGSKAFIKAVEGAEDSESLAMEDLKELGLKKEDVVCAIAASGRTPYCIGALKYGASVGAGTISISCNPGAVISGLAQIAIEVNAGPEILTGSTRLKAGTCQKLICNMISTASMAGIGKVYGNLMVDMKATNQKLAERAKGIVMQSTGCSYERAEEVLKETEYSTKEAIVMILTGTDRETAAELLKKNKGFVRKCISIE
ncbi:MAG: N-acetylmuramic acid 6-phosphate etherase [Lachnospiraceae bacterium]|nr:N-acetylmuramic acid 6-phosphate etherase [Lachnospiraceae bacterium]MCI9624950.1 N-acetylmuramic acid 6-phosphate etherase [Lachnospiraceae bacterium]